jgi:Na+-transporting NADH:ubiquinone oxidoreductase subunit A
VHRIRKGLDLPLSGAPEQRVDEARPVAHAALVAADFPGLKPSMEVKVGDRVMCGQPLLRDKVTPDLAYASPAAGRVAGIHRGERRRLLSVVVEVDPEACSGPGHDFAFDAYSGAPPANLEADAVRALLLESGLWSAFRTRPYSRVPAPGTRPAAIFVTAIDTHPLAPDPEVVLQGREDDFAAGLQVVAKLTEGSTYLCTTSRSRLVPPLGDILHERFEGPHPAGAPGTHIHLLDPVHREKTVWHLGYQDVAAIGFLFRTGRLDPSRVIAIAGPSVLRPRLVRTRLGAAVDELVADELAGGGHRVISGSVLGGRAARGPEQGYLGRYHNQVTVIPEGDERELLGWLKPGRDIFSVTNGFLSALDRDRPLGLSTATNGSARPMVPIGTYEAVMPLDVEPTFLLRSLIVGDLELAEQLGCLELDEEDVALATFACPGKYDYGPLLRGVLERIYREI